MFAGAKRQRHDPIERTRDLLRFWPNSFQTPVDASALSEARFHESVKLRVELCARSIEPFEGGRWRLRGMRANGWTRANGYGNLIRSNGVTRKPGTAFWRIGRKPGACFAANGPFYP